MRPLGGQAAHHAGRLVHALLQLTLAIFLTSVALIAALTWRLSQGPLDSPWLAARLADVVNADQAGHLTIGGAALAWEGFSGGVDRPLDIRVHDVVLTDAIGARIAAVPRAEVSLSVGRLLIGQIVPRALEVHGARLLVVRAVDGSVMFDLGDLRGGDVAPAELPPGSAAEPGGAVASVLRQLVQAPANDRTFGPVSRWSQMRRVHIRDAVITVIDRQLGATWGLRPLALDLVRGRTGGITGTGEAEVKLGPTLSSHMTLTAALDRATGLTDMTATLAQTVPAAVARAMPGLAALAPLDAPVTLSAKLQLDRDLNPAKAAARAEMGAGALHIAGEDALVFGGILAAEGTAAHGTVTLSKLEVAPRADAKHTVVGSHADIVRAPSGEMTVTGALDLDQVAFADLPALWPMGVGGPGARNWITQNIAQGMASHGHVDVGLTIPADFSDATVTKLAGGIDGSDLTVSWLKPVPPVEHVAAKLTLTDPDSMSIAVTGGAQAGGGIKFQGGHVTITGLAADDQFADIEADLAGPIADLLALLKNPRIKLLDRSPLPIKDAGGTFTGKVTVAKLPLRDAITMDDVAIRATAKTTGLKLAGIAAGRDIENGNLTIDAAAEGLHASGSVSVAGLPAQAQLDLDFRSGPKTQVLQRVAATATVQAKQLAGLGIDVGDFLTGSMAVSATLAIQRSGDGEAKIDADLEQAGVALGATGFAKPPGKPAKFSATVALAGDKLAGISAVRLEGDGVHLDASASFANGKPDLLTLHQAVFGTTTDFSGTVRMPKPGEPWQVEASGKSLDVSSLFDDTPAPKDAKPKSKTGPAYSADVKLDRVILGKGRVVAGVVAHADNDGTIMRRLTFAGRTLATGSGGGGKEGGAPFSLTIAPDGRGRRLSASTQDAGGLLLALGIDDKFERGKLSIVGTYDDTRQNHPLTGTAVVEDFSIHGAVFLAKLLQAMTLYGLVDAVRGPGLGFTKLEAPFTYAGDVLTLTDARAFSASLGMTAKGSIDLARRVADIEGTIVPAYFFNSLLGDIPLVGRIFSPEKGGGLFAATYSVHGPLDDPGVSVNPLAALTPGFLRGVFGIFDSTSKPTTMERQRPSK